MSRDLPSIEILYTPVALALAALLRPHAEVVLHDLATGRIAGIWNGGSGRRVGDESLVDELADSEAGALGPYEKRGRRGERLKSVTAVLPDAAGRPRGLLCINLDVSRFEAAARLLDDLVAVAAPQPRALFSRDWRENIQSAVAAWTFARGVAPAALAREPRRDLVRELDAQGLFATRHAAEHLAALLGVSRTTVYADLAAIRAGSPPRSEDAA